MRDRPLQSGTALILYSTQQLSLALREPLARRCRLARHVEDMLPA